jgi:short-subunit dehydrogenase involved in D-alanine esterification of teichoic acids
VKSDSSNTVRVAVITGGAMGIGGAAAQHLAAAGHRVCRCMRTTASTTPALPAILFFFGCFSLFFMLYLRTLLRLLR